MSTLYFKNLGSTSALKSWESSAHWWQDAAATVAAVNAPWVDGVDSTYLTYNLQFATGVTTAPVADGSNGGLSYGSGATGICNIANIALNGAGTIDGGNWSGASFVNLGSVAGGTFSGNTFTNKSSVYTGNFTGTGFINFANAGLIYGGVFNLQGFTAQSGSSITGGVGYSTSTAALGALISGNTYALTTTATYSDPGFAAAGGQFLILSSPSVSGVMSGSTSLNSNILAIGSL